MAGLLVGQPLRAMDLFGLDRFVRGGQLGLESGQLGTLLGSLGLPVLDLFLSLDQLNELIGDEFDLAGGSAGLRSSAVSAR